MYNTKYKWVFVHPEKCGGVSIEQILRTHYGYKNVVMDNKNQHYNISDYINTLDLPATEYFKFGCIRNPWDRMVSLYYHAVKHDNYKLDFDSFIYMIKYEVKKLSGFYKFCHNGKFIMDHVAKLETFELDVQSLMKKMGITKYVLSKYDHSTNRPRKPYREYYNKKSRSFIEEKFKWDIEYFDYEF